MAGEMFGSPIGESVALNDALRQDQVFAQMAMLPARMQQGQAQARFTAARAQMAEQQAAVQRRFAESLARQRQFATAANAGHEDSTAPQEQRNPMWQMADAAMEAGDPNAYKYVNAASMVDYRTRTAETQRMRGAEAGIRTQVALLDLKARLTDGVQDDAGLLAAAKDYEQTTGQSSGLLDAQGNLTVRYSPELIGRIRAQAISMKDQMLQNYRDRSLQSAERERKSKQENRAFWQDMDNQAARAEARWKATHKDGDSSKLFPTATEIKIGADYLAKKFNIGADEPWARVNGRELIDEMKRVSAANPAMTKHDAMNKAYDNLNKQHRFDGHVNVDTAQTLATPQPLPANRKDLVKDQVYFDDSGVARTWTGEGWSTAVGGAGTIKPLIGDPNSDDDDLEANPAIEDDDDE